MAIEKHSSALLERHTRAAKDGVIDMLSEKASKLGVSLERALLAKREIEDGANKLQVPYRPQLPLSKMINLRLNLRNPGVSS